MIYVNSRKCHFSSLFYLPGGFPSNFLRISSKSCGFPISEYGAARWCEHRLILQKYSCTAISIHPTFSSLVWQYLISPDCQSVSMSCIKYFNLRIVCLVSISRQYSHGAGIYRDKVAVIIVDIHMVLPN